MNRFLFPVSAFLSLAIVVPAVAGPVETAKAVSYADLDIANAAGQMALRARIAHAVKVVCGDAAGQPLALVMDVNRCRKQAAAASAPKVALVIDRAERLARRDGTYQYAGR